jgi:ribonuclease HII
MARTMRIDPNLKFERRLWKAGYRYIAGLDEAGRGAIAGPVAVGAVMLAGGRRQSGSRGAGERTQASLKGVRDSKQMTASQREAAVVGIQRCALAWGVGFASPAEIDSDGIVRAVRLAALRAVEALGVFPEYLLTDFRLELPMLDIGQAAIVRGDGCCLSIAAASVLAKTARDALMREMDVEQPGYGLAAHKGYGTWAHRLAVKRLGRSPIHRQSFSISF